MKMEELSDGEKSGIKLTNHKTDLNKVIEIEPRIVKENFQNKIK